MTSEELIEIPGGEGLAVSLEAGQALKIVNTHGSQVIDTWAVSAADPSEYLSVEHTRRMTGHLHPVVGDLFWSNRRSEMLLLEEDSFPGTHDTLVACCDAWLYAHYGCPPGHRSCNDNFVEALQRVGVSLERAPNPVNLWMNVPVEGNEMTVTPPLSRPGDHVVLRARMPLNLVMSACPMDIVPINGEDCEVRSVHVARLP